LWFSLLEQRALWDPDEGRYAEIAREMVASGDWITPRLNDLLYFEKPPLQYWTTAAAYTLFGAQNWSARLWSALTGLAGVLFLVYAGRRLHSLRAGIVAGAMLASSTLYFGLAHLNTLDMGLAFFGEISVFALALGLRSATQDETRRWILLAWCAAALAVLSKGLIGILLPTVTLFAYSILHRDFSIWKRLSPVAGGALFLLISAPWFIAVMHHNPDFAQFFFVHEHFTRFLTTEHHRAQPLWFFLPVLALGALPWSFPIALGLWQACTKRRASAAFDPTRFLVVWVAVVFTFFSASGSKLVPYILPVFPALAFLGARYLGSIAKHKVARCLFWSGIVSAALVVAVAYVLASRVGSDGVAQVTTACLAAALTCALGAVLARAVAHRGAVVAATIALAVPIMLAFQITLYAGESLPGRSTLPLAQQIKPHLGDSTRIYALGMYPQSLPFYLERTVTLAGFRGELDFGLTREPEKGIAGLDEFIERWARERDAIAVMSKTLYGELSARGVQMQLIGADPASVAVRRP
jgi:4-amino-4-deoxy-L-arabinose transferase-like glycosyltransferase